MADTTFTDPNADPNIQPNPYTVGTQPVGGATKLPVNTGAPGAPSPWGAPTTQVPGDTFNTPTPAPAGPPGTPGQTYGTPGGPASAQTNPQTTPIWDTSTAQGWMSLVGNQSGLLAWVRSQNPSLSDADAQYYATQIKGRPGLTPDQQAGGAAYWEI